MLGKKVTFEDERADHLVVNLSSCLPSGNVWESLWAFAELKWLCVLQNHWPNRVDYALLHPTSFFNNLGRVLILPDLVNTYRSPQVQDIITKYKKGLRSTQEFLAGLLEKLLPELGRIDYPKEVKRTVSAQQRRYFCLQHLHNAAFPEELTSQDIALTLIEKAWVCRIKPLQEEHKRYVDKLLKGHFTFISNSNPLDIWCHLLHLSEARPSRFQAPSQLNIERKGVPLNIACSHPPALCFLSYQFNLYKTEGLWKKVKETFSPGAPLKAVSQYPKDLKMAASLAFHSVATDRVFFDKKTNASSHLAVLGGLSLLIGCVGACIFHFPALTLPLLAMAGIGVGHCLDNQAIKISSSGFFAGACLGLWLAHDHEAREGIGAPEL